LERWSRRWRQDCDKYRTPKAEYRRQNGCSRIELHHSIPLSACASIYYLQLLEITEGVKSPICQDLCSPFPAAPKRIGFAAASRAGGLFFLQPRIGNPGLQQCGPAPLRQSVMLRGGELGQNGENAARCEKSWASGMGNKRGIDCPKGIHYCSMGVSYPMWFGLPHGCDSLKGLHRREIGDQMVLKLTRMR